MWWLFGNPFLALIVLLVLLYALDRRFVGVTPSIVKPYRRLRMIGRLRQQAAMNPNDIPAKHELGRLLVERKRYKEAKEWLMPLQDALEQSAEYWDDLGSCLAGLSETAAAEAAINNALAINPRVKYGAPYLRLASLYAKSDPARAIGYLQSFRHIQSSSCEAYYRLAGMYRELGRKEDEKEALAECRSIYRMLPRYKKRSERKWALMAWLRFRAVK
nr:hypothetical protein [Paenibacillus oenotherae]